MTKNDTLKLLGEVFDLKEMMVATTVLYLQKNTSVASEHADNLVRMWPKLEEDLKSEIRKHVEDEFALLHQQRDLGLKGRPAFGGALAILSSWEELRSFWHTEEDELRDEIASLNRKVRRLEKEAGKK